MVRPARDPEPHPGGMAGTRRRAAASRPRAHRPRARAWRSGPPVASRRMKGPLLVIDASTYRGTVALVDGRSVLAQRDAMMRGESEERLMPAVAAVLADRGLRP